MSDRLNELRNLISEALEKTRPMKVYPKQQSEYLGFVDFSNDPQDPDIHIVGYGVLSYSRLAKEAAEGLRRIADIVPNSPNTALSLLLMQYSTATIGKIRALAEAQNLISSSQGKRTQTLAKKARG